MLQRFFVKLSEAMKPLRSEHLSSMFRKSLDFQLLAVKCNTCLMFFFRKIFVILIQSRLKLCDLTVLAAGVETNKFVIRSHNGAILCLYDRTEDRI